MGGAETSEFIRQAQLMWDAWPDNCHPAAGPLILAGKHHFSVVAEYADPDSELTRATLSPIRFKVGRARPARRSRRCTIDN